MDVTTAAKIQGPALRRQSLLMGLLIIVGSTSLAIFRVARDGEVDGVTVFWSALAVIASLALSSVELSSNRRLASAARLSRRTSDDYIVMFRVGQVTNESATAASRFMNKGWIRLSAGDLTITAYRGRSIVGRYEAGELSSVEVVAAPRAYGVLVLAFADGSKFESIPVETGLRNAGLSPERLKDIAALILRACTRLHAPGPPNGADMPCP